MKILRYIDVGILIPIYEISFNGKKFAITRATSGIGASTAQEAEESKLLWELVGKQY